MSTISPRDGGVVQYSFTQRAYTAILAFSKLEPIPPANRYNPAGNQVIVPPSAFPVFNGFMTQGEIMPGPVTGG